MKKIASLFILFLIVSCSNDVNKALKSTDKDYILKIGNQYYENKKYKNALVVYEHLSQYVVGTEYGAEVSYKTAYSNFYDKNYALAARQFKNYSNSFVKEKNREEAAYMGAKCFYMASPAYNLDQTNTTQAIAELQSYIDNYPNSPSIPESNKLMQELTQKLEKKAYENAITLYKIMEYKAAIVSFDNILNDFPDTSLKENVLMYIVRSSSELAVNSVYSLKQERITDAEQNYVKILRQYPQTKYVYELERIKSRLEGAKKSFAEATVKIEEARKNKERKALEANK